MNERNHIASEGLNVLNRVKRLNDWNGYSVRN